MPSIPNVWSQVGWYAFVAILAGIAFIVGFGAGRPGISSALGGGDLLPAYAAGKLWSDGSPLGNNTLGYPWGMNLGYYPTTDILQNATAGMLGEISGNIFLGMNLVWALSFPATAVASLWVLQLTGLRGWPAAIGALALTTVPYHWYRLDHIYLGTMYSAVIGVGIALLVGSGRAEKALARRRALMPWLAMLGLAGIVATSGIYYACFTILLAFVAVVMRFARGAPWRALAFAATPGAAVAALTAVALIPSTVFSVSHPPLEAVAERYPVESVQYSGALAFTLLPAPTSLVPGFGPVNEWVAGAIGEAVRAPSSGVLWLANSGSIFTIVAMAFCCIGGLAIARRGAHSFRDARPADSAEPISPGLVIALSLVALLFFVPWGLNFLFALVVTPQLRGWDRLVPVLFTLLFVAAGVTWRRLGVPQHGRIVAVVAVVALLVLVGDSVLPYRTYFASASANGRQFTEAGRAYAADLNTSVPGQCGVLQLPFMGYPEVPPSQEMSAYEHLWPALTNAQKSWSFGAMKGTVDSQWLQGLESSIDSDAIEHLREGGFCAIHVDARGYTAEDAARIVSELSILLGRPVATGLEGNWNAFRIPEAHEALHPDDILGGSLDDLFFFAPPNISEVGESVRTERGDWLTTRWLTAQETIFALSAVDDRAGFWSVSGVVSGSDCAAGTYELRFSGDGAVVVESVSLGASESEPFELTIPTGHPLRSAEFVVTTSSEPCETDLDPRPRTGAILNLEASRTE